MDATLGHDTAASIAPVATAGGTMGVGSPLLSSNQADFYARFVVHPLQLKSRGAPPASALPIDDIATAKTSKNRRNCDVWMRAEVIG